LIFDPLVRMFSTDKVLGSCALFLVEVSRGLPGEGLPRWRIIIPGSKWQVAHPSYAICGREFGEARGGRSFQAFCTTPLDLSSIQIPEFKLVMISNFPSHFT
jgi:hypothetical protein